jgi:hypothetical protein
VPPVSAPQGPGRRSPWLRRAADTTPIRHGPIQFRSEPPPDRQNPVLIWVLRGLGLLAVAVISGLVWWYIHEDKQPAQTVQETTEQRTGQFEFTPVKEVPQPLHDSKCADHAYEQVRSFLQSTPCQQLTRALYTTSTSDGRKVYTNVSVVRMATADDAAKLRALTDKDGTGNVNDLVREGMVKIPPLRSLSAGGGYRAVQHDRNVIIVESDYDPTVKAKDEPTLDAICEDAIRLGDQIGASP